MNWQGRQSQGRPVPLQPQVIFQVRSQGLIFESPFWEVPDGADGAVVLCQRLPTSKWLCTRLTLMLVGYDIVD
jgi:hypothetical protein